LATCDGARESISLADNEIDPGLTVQNVHCSAGAVSPSASVSDLPVPPLSVGDRLITDRSRFNRRTDSVSADESDAKVRIDEFGYIYDVLDSDHTEDSNEYCDEVSLPGSSETPTPDVDVDAMRRTVQNAPGHETQMGSDAFCTQPINLQSANCDEETSQRPRRNLRHLAKYLDYNTDFANSQYIRRIRKSVLRENGISSQNLSTRSRDSSRQQTRPLIGPHSCLCCRPVVEEDINESCVELVQL